MSPTEEQRARQVQEKVHGLIDDLDVLHKRLRELTSKLEEIESDADDAGLDRVKFALRDAYVGLSQAGSKLVEAHINMNIPPTAYRQSV